MKTIEKNKMNPVITKEEKNYPLSNWNPFILVLLRTVLFVGVIGVFSMFISGDFQARITAIAPFWPFTVILVNIISFPMLIWISHLEGTSYAQLINRSYSQFKGIKKWFAPLLLIIIALVGMYLTAFLVYGMTFLEPANAGSSGIEAFLPQWAISMMLPIPLWAGIIAVILLPITVSLVEIPLYLGYCMPRIEKRLDSRFMAIVIVAFFFSFQHAFIPFTGSIELFIWRAICYLPLTLFLTIWYRKENYQENLVPVMIAHFVIDLIAMLQLIVVILFI